MTDSARPIVVVPQTLGRLRLRLTAWYVGTYVVVLTLLGVALFAIISSRIDEDLDRSIEAATRSLIGEIRIRGIEGSDLVIPDRRLMVYDTAGAPIDIEERGKAGESGESGENEPWISALAKRAAAAKNGVLHEEREGDRVNRAYAERFIAPDGRRAVAVAIADEIELEDKYTTLIATMAGAALVAMLLVAAGGWIVARQSTAPVERSMEQMRRFMADAAHELRTPLSVVRSRAEVTLQRERAPAEYQEALGAIERETTRVGRIVEDLLMLARAEAGERPIEHQRVFLDDIALDAAEAARALGSRKGVYVDVDEYEEAPVLGDATLLRQLIMILLDNAIKFSRERGLVLVGVKSAGAMATLTVSDQGIGIDERHLPHVFDRFYRGDESRAREGSAVSEGAGLGLSIAQWIVTEHRGAIYVESQQGVGTKVVVEIPVAAETVS